MAGVLINGDYFSFQDLEISIAGPLFVGFHSISYSDDLGRTYVRGAARKPIGTTAGRYEPKCEMELYWPAWLTFLNTALIPLGLALGGWRKVPFNISVAYTAVIGLPINTDTIVNATVKTVEASHSESEDALLAKLTLFPQEVLWGGIVSSILEPAKLFAIG